MIEFYKIRDAECDFCKKKKAVVTQANYTYICRACAVKINKHARVNEFVVQQEKKGGIKK